METLYKVCGISVWPLALTPSGQVHMGLSSFDTLRIEINDDDLSKPTVTGVRCRLTNQGTLTDIQKEVLENLGLDVADAQRLMSLAGKKLNATEMCEVMKTSSRMLTALGDKLPKERESSFKVNVLYSGAFYTDPVTHLGDLQTIQTGFCARIPDGDKVKDAVKSYYIHYQWDSISVKEEPDFALWNLMDSSRRHSIDFWNYKAKLEWLKDDIDVCMTGSPRSLRCGRAEYQSEIDTPTPEFRLYTVPPMVATVRRGADAAYVGCGVKPTWNEKGIAWEFNYYGFECYTTTDDDGKNVIKTRRCRSSSRYKEADEYVALPVGDDAYLGGKKFGDFFKEMPTYERVCKMLRDYDDRVRSIAFCIIHHTLYPDDKRTEFMDRGYAAVSQLETLCHELTLEQKRDATVMPTDLSSAKDICVDEGSKTEDGVVVTLGGEILNKDNTDVVFDFVSFTTQGGVTGCYPVIQSISETAQKSGGLVISVPKYGVPSGAKKKLPVLRLTPDFCGIEFRDNIRGVILPETLVQLVGAKNGVAGVFSDYGRLEFVDMSACTKLKLIGASAFKNCTKLHNIFMPDIPASDSYIIHKGAFSGLPAVSELNISAYEVLTNAFSDVDIYSLKFDAVKVGSTAFGKNTKVASTVTIGESLKEVGAGGLTRILEDKSLDVKLPNIVKLTHGAMVKGGTGFAKIELGKTLTTLGEGALEGWDDVTIHAEKGANKGALIGVRHVLLHANSDYEVDAVKHVPMSEICYFEGEEMSDYRKEAQEYVDMMELFFAEKGSTFESYIARELDDIRYPGIITEEYPTLEGIIGEQYSLTDAQIDFYRNGKQFPVFSDKLDNEIAADAEALVDIATLRMLKAVAKPFDTQLINLFSAEKLYSKTANHTICRKSANLCVERFRYVTADLTTEITMYLVGINGGGKYLFMENSADARLMSPNEVLKALRATADPGVINSIDYCLPPAFEKSGDAETGGDISAPFIIPGDTLCGDTPTLLAHNFCDRKTTAQKYVYSIFKDAGIVRVGNEYFAYNPLVKWFLSCETKVPMRVHEREVSVGIDDICNKITGRKKSPSNIVTDANDFRYFAGLAAKPPVAKSSDVGKVMDIYKGLIEATKGKKTLALSRDLFDSITEYMSYVMSKHDEKGALSDERNLTVSSETKKRKLLADGLYLQCFDAKRKTLGHRMTRADLTDATKVIFRGGEDRVWYRLYDSDKSDTPVATYVCNYPLSVLEEHLKRYKGAGLGKASEITYGKLVPKSRFVFDSKTMPMFFGTLTYEDVANSSVANARIGYKDFKGSSEVGCAVDRLTGRWYLVSDDIVAKRKKADKDATAVNDKFYVLFPISNIAFVSMVVSGIGNTEVTTTKEYLSELLLALHLGEKESTKEVLARYKEAVAELSKADCDRRKIAELTDFFLAPCLG